MSKAPPLDFDVAVHQIMARERGRLLSLLITYVNDFQLAEDALQDAFLSALHHWQENGLPQHPRAWLFKTAKHKAIDRIRRHSNFQKKQIEYQQLLEMDQADKPKEDEYTIPDERLRLIFTCCHPALDQKISVALTLQLVTGLNTTEIARAFLVKPETMAQRLVRGKRKIKQTGIPYIIPEREVFAERLAAVLAVLYLIFNEGYSASSGPRHIRKELCLEAIRLAHLLRSLCPKEPEVKALLALMLLHDARRPARYNEYGDFIPLEDQDRSLWLKGQIDEGIALVQSALKQKKIGIYQLQAAISAIHSEAPDYAKTNWPEILLLYDEIYKIQPTPVILLNRLVALSYVETVTQAMKLLDDLAEYFDNYQPFYAVKADFYRRMDYFQDAAINYRKAIQLSGNKAEKLFLAKRLKEMTLYRRSQEHHQHVTG